MKPTIINSDDLSTLRLIGGTASETRDLLSTNADRGTKARPTVAQLNTTLKNLDMIAEAVGLLIERMIVPAPIENASEPERIIVGKLVADLLAAGFWISVFDGEETTVKRSIDATEIFPALASTGVDHLNVGRVGDTHRMGWVVLVWGNDCAVISDYTINLTEYVVGANKLAEVLDGGND